MIMRENNMVKREEDRYEIIYLYVKRFEWKYKHIGNNFNFEPAEGCVYRAIYDKKGKMYKIPLNGNGLVITKLTLESEAMDYEMLEFNYDNMKDIILKDSEINKISEWEKGTDAKEFIEKYTTDSKDEPVEVKEYDDDIEEVGLAVPSDVAPMIKAMLDELMLDYVDIFKARDGIADALSDLVGYVSSTYSDKYAEPSPLEARRFSYSRAHGASVNMFCASKYIQRYLTDGYSKSRNPIDLLKAMHYILYELARVKIIEYAEEFKRELGEGSRGDESPNKESEKGNRNTKNKTKRSRGNDNGTGA